MEDTNQLRPLSRLTLHLNCRKPFCDDHILGDEAFKHEPEKPGSKIGKSTWAIAADNKRKKTDAKMIVL